MTNRRDDMVITPQLRKQSREEFKAERKGRRGLFRRQRKRGFLRRLARARAANKLRAARKARAARGVVAAAKTAGKVATAVRGAKAVGSMAKVGGGWVAAGAAAFVVGFGVVYKLGTGKSMKVIGQELNNAIFGTEDDLARAAATARAIIGSNPRILNTSLNEDGSLPAHIVRIFQSELGRQYRIETFRSVVDADERIQTQEIIDVVIDSARPVFQRALIYFGVVDAAMKKLLEAQFPKGGGR